LIDPGQLPREAHSCCALEKRRNIFPDRSTLRAVIVLSTFPGQTSHFASGRRQNRFNFTKKNVNFDTTAVRGTQGDKPWEICEAAGPFYNTKNTAIA
jgi:hypothetical protein